MVYAATLAPGVTFWDAGEFIAAIHAFGIPHPPGTPLFIALSRAWSTLLPGVAFAVRTNLFSAVCTAAAGALVASLVARWSRSAALGFAAAMCACATYSIWSNATETEVYAPALLLSVLALAAADRVGRARTTRERGRWTAITAYCFALAAPLHVSALIAAPAAVLLASYMEQPGGASPAWRAMPSLIDWRTAIPLTLAFLFAGAAGTATLWLAVVSGGALLLLAVAADRTRDMPALARVLPAPRDALQVAGVAMLGATGLVILLLRARQLPSIDQGHPATWAQLAWVVSRKQYAVAGMFPRLAPFWLQVANWFEWADWQFALGLHPDVQPTVARVLVTLAYAALAIVGARRQARTHHRSFATLLMLFVCGSVGVLLWLNMHAGASFGWGFLPDTVPHEARERDYFFVDAFLVWGIWAAWGAMTLSRAWFGRRTPGLIVALLPVAFNWRAATRRTPEAALPAAVAHALLDSAPRNAVLFMGGDNDSYPLWFAQEVNGMRRDVTLVTIPLLGATWYREQLAERSGLLDLPVPGWRGEGTEVADMAAHARQLGRPVAVAVSATQAERLEAGKHWRLEGFFYVDPDDPADTMAVSLDTAAIIASANRLKLPAAVGSRESVDPVDEVMSGFLRCPDAALAWSRARTRGEPLSDSTRALLDSRCNLR